MNSHAVSEIPDFIFSHRAAYENAAIFGFSDLDTKPGLRPPEFYDGWEEMFAGDVPDAIIEELGRLRLKVSGYMAVGGQIDEL